MVYFVPEAEEEYSRLGIVGTRMGYFASRSAAFGTDSAEVVIATFYNFDPGLVRSVIPAAWSLVTPSDVLAARCRAAGRALRRGLGNELAGAPSVAEATTLARRAAEAACQRPEDRPLFAAHSSLEWPDEPLLDLWHAQTLLREYRGDGHIAALLLADLDPVEALVMHEASGEMPAGVLQASRAWGDADWSAAVERLHDRGLVTADGRTLTDIGSALRQRIEDETDLWALYPYRQLGEDDCHRLREVARPLSRAVVEKGLLNAASMTRIADS